MHVFFFQIKWTDFDIDCDEGQFCEVKKSNEMSNDRRSVIKNSLELQEDSNDNITTSQFKFKLYKYLVNIRQIMKRIQNRKVSFNFQ